MNDLEWRQAYRNAIETLWSYQEGQEVVKDLFINKLMTFRDDIKGEGDLAISNLGRQLLGYIGCSDIDVSGHATIDALLKTPVHIKKKEVKKDET
jgi:hypothetical protein